MTPGARLSAAMAVLNVALSGTPLEKALTGWARASRYAGSSDRAAVRDLAYGAWRCRRSFAAVGGAETGRGLILGGLRVQGADIAGLMTGDGHAPAAPTPEETGRTPTAGAEALDVPDWLWPRWQADLGADAEPAAQAAQYRAPVFLRVNLSRGTRAAAAEALRAEGIGTVPHAHVKTALEVTDNPRKVAQSRCFLNGLIELQDAASQAAVAALPLRDAMRVLDYCAGGGGKALAMADRVRLDLWAHDTAPQRLADVPARALRAGVAISIVPPAGPAALAPFDLVLVDAPCSGSGTWRRDPDGKWRLSADRLTLLTTLQAEILDAAQAFVAPDGALAYATCSVLAAETTAQIAAFCDRSPGWTVVSQTRWLPGPTGDGFSLAILRRGGRHNL